MSNHNDDDEILVKPPIYLVGKKIYCWRCETKMSVISILAPNVKEDEEVDEERGVCLFSNIVELPNVVLSYIQKRVPTFLLRYSKTEGRKYYANTCPKCNSISGDFFLHCEPGAPFFPTDNVEAQSLFITEIPLSNSIKIDGSISVGAGELILKNAKKIS
jgi:hypothetical protein